LADLDSAARRLALYYAYAVLKDGRVLVGGGEYHVASRVDLPSRLAKPSERGSLSRF
jgi:hypothetical protein